MSNTPMDPFDEFEFKPLTDGLGFHKKQVSLKDGLKRSGVLEDELQGIPTSIPQTLIEDKPAVKTPPIKKHTFEDVLSALEKTPIKTPAMNVDLKFTETLPREPEKKKAMDVEIPTVPVQSPFPRSEVFKAPLTKKIPMQSDLASVGTRRGAADSPQRKLFPATISFESVVLDFVIVMGLSLVFMVALLLVTKVDLNIVIKNVGRDLMTQLSLSVLFVAVMQMYVVIARSFFGRTLGEWTFDMQLGEDDEQSRENYPLKVAMRSLITTVTGLVFLPLISTALGRDIAGQITGLQLYKQRT